MRQAQRGPAVRRDATGQQASQHPQRQCRKGPRRCGWQREAEHDSAATIQRTSRLGVLFIRTRVEREMKQAERIRDRSSGM